MPQLDKFTFGSQVLWLVVLFLFCYFLVLRGSLPRLYKVLFFRKRVLENYYKELYSLDKELFYMETALQKNLVKPLSLLRHMGDSLFKFFDQDLNMVVNKEKFNLQFSKELTLSLDARHVLQSIHVAYSLNNNKFISMANKSLIKSKIF